MGDFIYVKKERKHTARSSLLYFFIFYYIDIYFLYVCFLSTSPSLTLPFFFDFFLYFSVRGACLVALQRRAFGSVDEFVTMTYACR